PPGRGDFWILKIAHASSPKNLSKIGFRPRKGVAFLWKAFFLQKKFFRHAFDADNARQGRCGLPSIKSSGRARIGGALLSLRQPKRSDLRPPVPYSCSVLRRGRFVAGKGKRASGVRLGITARYPATD